MRRLTKEEFKATIDDKMTPLGEDAVPPFDFWPYVESIPEEDFQGFDFSEGLVDFVYVDSKQRYQLVHVGCKQNDIFLVIVLDMSANAVHGHYVLNLDVEYGAES